MPLKEIDTIMKKHVIWIAFLLFHSFLASQTITEEDKQKLIQALDTAECSDRFHAIAKIVDDSVYEALPTIERTIFSQSADIVVEMLHALDKFQSSNLPTIAKRIFDSSGVIVQIPCTDGTLSIPSISNLDKLKYEALWSLFHSGDYSHVPQYFALLNEDVHNSDLFGELLPLVIQHVPIYADSAKQKLLWNVGNASVNINRWSALYNLERLYGNPLSFDLVSIASANSNGWIRMLAIEGLFRFGYPDVKPFLIQRLHAETEPTIRGTIADSLLLRFGTPTDYEAVRQYLLTEQDTITKDVRNARLRDFRPPHPFVSASLLSLTDTLHSNVTELQTLNWIGDANFISTLSNYISSAKSSISQHDSSSARQQLVSFQQAVDREYRDSTNITPAFVTVEGWKFLYYNAQYIIERLPSSPHVNIKLVNSLGTKLSGGALQYYEGTWKDAVNNNDGTFTVNTSQQTLSLRMTYAYGTQTKSNVAVGSGTVVFQTVNTQVKLQNSQGSLIDTGTVQYYAGAWRNFGMTINGIATKELLPANYSFRMIYAHVSNDKTQDVGKNGTMNFSTVLCTVRVKDLQNNPVNNAVVTYYSGAWRQFGNTINGDITKELFSGNLQFRAKLGSVHQDKTQNLSANPSVEITLNVGQ